MPGPPPAFSNTIPDTPNSTLQGIYANSTILLADNYGISAGNIATTNDTGFAALHAAMIAGPSTIWHVIFSPGVYTYTNNRWLWGIQNVIVDAYGASFQCTTTDPNYQNAIPLNVNDFFDDGGNVPVPHSTFVNGYLINTANSGATSVTTSTASDAGIFSAGMRVLVYGYDQQQGGYPPNMRYFEEKTVSSVNASTGVVTFTKPLQYFYDSRWWDTTNYDGLGLSYGAPRILSLQRANYTRAQLIWIKGGNFLANSNTPTLDTLQLTGDIVIYEDVKGLSFNAGQSGQTLIISSNFTGDVSNGDKMIDSLLIQDSTLDPAPIAPNIAFSDCVGCNSLSIIRSTFYGNINLIAPRNLLISDSDIYPNPSTSYQGIGTAGGNPIWSVSIGNTRVYNTGSISYGFTNVATPGNSVTVGSVSGTTLQMTWNSTAVTVADQVDYGMTLTDTTAGCTGTVTGIYLTGGNTLNIAQKGCSSPRGGDTVEFYDVINKYDQGGNVIVGAQVPFWRGPPVLASP